MFREGAGFKLFSGKLLPLNLRIELFGSNSLPRHRSAFKMNGAKCFLLLAIASTAPSASSRQKDASSAPFASVLIVSTW